MISQGKKLCFVSNNSSKSRAEYLQRFRNLGMTAFEVITLYSSPHTHTLSLSLSLTKQEEIFCTAYIAAHYLKHSLKLQGKVYLIGMPGFGDELRLQGIPYIGPGVRKNPPQPYMGMFIYRTRGKEEPTPTLCMYV